MSYVSIYTTVLLIIIVKAVFRVKTICIWWANISMLAEQRAIIIASHEIVSDVLKSHPFVRFWVKVVECDLAGNIQQFVYIWILSL